MQNRIPNGAGRFIAPAKTKLKLALTFEGPFAEQLRQWAEQSAARWKQSPNHTRIVRAEQRRLAVLLLCEAIGACAERGALPLVDQAVFAVGAPRMKVVAGQSRRAELIEHEYLCRGLPGVVAVLLRDLRN